MRRAGGESHAAHRPPTSQTSPRARTSTCTHTSFQLVHGTEGPARRIAAAPAPQHDASAHTHAHAHRPPQRPQTFIIAVGVTAELLQFVIRLRVGVVVLAQARQGLQMICQPSIQALAGGALHRDQARLDQDLGNLSNVGQGIRNGCAAEGPLLAASGTQALHREGGPWGSGGSRSRPRG